ncbi:ATP-binding protein [Methanoregula sp.]|uniref:ATP-binding protein n=1 Tax=Methanoregula sp. TaxID=2052170 RepID=UPI003C732A9F
MMTLNDIDTTDKTKFRLIGKSVLAYRFIVPHDAGLFVGDIIKIEDETKKYTFFAKVTDLFHESNFADQNWDTRPYSEQFYGLGEDVFIGVEAVPLGFIDEANIFRKPRTVPVKFSRVSIPGAEDFDFLKKVMGDIEVGVIRTGQEDLKGVPVKIPSAVLPQHMGVFATTGMGKSNFMRVFCASSMKARLFGLLIVDPHGEYVRGGKSSTGETSKGLPHYSAGKEGLAIFSIDKTNQKKYGANQLWLEYDDFRMGDLSLLYELSPAQSEAIEALEEFSGSKTIAFFLSVEDIESLPDQVKDGTYRGIYPEIADRLKSFHPSTLQSIQRKVKIIAHGNERFFRSKGSAIQEIINALHDHKVVLIDIPRMSERSELFILSMITRHILHEHRKTAEEFGIEDESAEQHQILIAIDEAQRVLASGGSSTQVFRECAMEGRKFGVGLCVITQQPKNVDPKVLAQINTFIIMGLGDRGDRDIVMSSAKQDLSRMEVEIQTLDRGEAIISTLSIPFPVSTRIHKFEEYLTVLNAEKKEDIRDGLSTGFS